MTLFFFSTEPSIWAKNKKQVSHDQRLNFVFFKQGVTITDDKRQREARAII